MNEVTAIPEKLKTIQQEIGKAVVGNEDVVRQIITAVLAGGHVLLEGAPGLGKTLVIKTAGTVMGLDTGRIQFTPDLMPGDIIGTEVLVQDDRAGQRVVFRKGPVFTNILLADEINRGTPKTQSALLEAMQELTVTVGGTSYRLEPPFIVLATQNPIEMEGTYPLPEAQMDRFFFKITVGYPVRKDLSVIADRTTGSVMPELSPAVNREEILSIKEMIREIPVPQAVKEYAVSLVQYSHPGAEHTPEDIKRYVRYGASPRGVISLILAGKVMALFDGRYNVGFDDIRNAAYPALRHRLILNFEGEAEGKTPEDIIGVLLNRVPEHV
ncbi:MAG: AAA family ATPase [Spirochaetia bacterium]